MRYSFIALLLISASLTACKVPEEVAKQPTPQKPVAREQVDAIEARKQMEVMKKQEPMDDNMMQEESGEYTTYVDGVIGNGETSVLFFHAEWCPYCIANSKRLTTWYGDEDFPRSVYKIDFDTALELRKQFNVAGQDTFILIDGDGNEIERVSFPSETALRALLG